MIDENTIKYLANLSRLKFSKEDEENMIVELEKILEHVENLNELDTSNVEPLTHMFGIENIYREDVVAESYSKEDILKNATNKNEDYFIVPKTVGQGGDSN